MANFSLGKHAHVDLCDLLKLEGWVESGGSAKEVIAAGLVSVDGQVETRKRCKIVAGQQVAFNGNQINVTDLTPVVEGKPPLVRRGLPCTR
ncbi:MAG: putative protein YbcJ [Candidatus Erwinia impunctatus]|nr:putative protein YbcJ [Culicoides impunctatus]